jgi:hypothetical protein
MALNDWDDSACKLESMWRENLMAWFKLIASYISVNGEENHKKAQ